jgi:hypothetical protein
VPALTSQGSLVRSQSRPPVFRGGVSFLPPQISEGGVNGAHGLGKVVGRNLTWRSVVRADLQTPMTSHSGTSRARSSEPMSLICWHSRQRRCRRRRVHAVLAGRCSELGYVPSIAMQPISRSPQTIALLSPRVWHVSHRRRSRAEPKRANRNLTQGPQCRPAWRACLTLSTVEEGRREVMSDPILIWTLCAVIAVNIIVVVLAFTSASREARRFGGRSPG